MQSKIKYHMVKLGYCFMTAMAFLMAVTFLYSYFFTDKIFSISINSYGEATIELAIICFAIPCIFFALLDSKAYMDHLKHSFEANSMTMDEQVSKAWDE